MKENKIYLQRDGNIIVQNVQGENIAINTNDPADIKEKLQQLNDTQIAVIKKLADAQANELDDVFKTLLAYVLSQKNIVYSDISVISEKTGDEIHYHYHSEKTKIPKELTTKIPKRSQDKIVGRETELEDLHQRLCDGKQVVLVNELGGIGKTTLAQVYVAKYWNEYAHIAWISLTSEDIVTDFVSTEGLLHSLNIQGADKDSKDLFKEILSSLNELEDKPGLLIIDNADASLSQWYDHLPGQPNWHILVTSRVPIHRFATKELVRLTKNETVTLFLSHYTYGKITEKQIRELVTAINYHTLTVEILAKIAQIQKTEINHVEKTIRDDLKAGVYVKPIDDKLEKATSYLCSIFVLSQLTDAEIWMLKQFTCLPPEFHSYDRLKELIISSEDPNEAVFSQTMEELCAKGWLLENKETNSFKMHSMIADVVRKQLTIVISDIIPLIENAAEKLRIDQIKDNPIDKFPWVPYGRTILDTFPGSVNAKISTLQNNLALRLKDLGDYEGAKTLLEEALQSAKKNLGAGHPTTAVRYFNLALVLQSLGDYERAKMLLEKALRSAEKNLGLDHPTTAVRNSNLALVLKNLGDNNGAKKLLAKALRSAEKNFGPDHPTTAVRYSNLATVLKDLGEYEEAKTLLEKALRSAEKNFGPEHPTTAVRYSNLATVLKDLGDYEGAKTLLEKALRLDEKNFGPEHATTAASYSNLALVLQDLGDYEEAKKLLEKALQLDEKNFGPEHPTTAVSYSNLALVLKDLGDYKGAKTLMEKALQSDEKNFGSEHPTTAVSYSNLALVLKDLGDYEGALELSARALQIFQNVLPEGHPDIKTVSNIYQSLKSQLK